MNIPLKLKWMYPLIAGFLVLFSAQLASYTFRAIVTEEPQSAILTFIAGGLVLGYTFIRLFWRIGSQAYLSWKWIRHFRSIQDMKLSRRLAYKYQRFGSDIIVVKDASIVALVIGMRKPVIVISTGVLGMFSDDEVKAILFHEWHHCRNRDNVKMFLARLLTEAFGYLPIMRSIYRYYQTWTELLADRFAITRMGTELPLAGVLLKLSKLGSVRSQMASVHMAAVHFATATMQYRIAQALEPDKTVKVKVALLRPLLISCTLLLLLLLSGDS